MAKRRPWQVLPTSPYPNKSRACSYHKSKWRMGELTCLARGVLLPIIIFLMQWYPPYSDSMCNIDSPAADGGIEREECDIYH